MTSADLTVPPPMPEPTVREMTPIDPPTGYTAHQIAARDAQWSERITSLQAAAETDNRLRDQLAEAIELLQQENATLHECCRANEEAISAANAEVASLQARLDAAERLLRGARDYVQGNVDEQRQNWGNSLMHRQRIDIDFLAEIDSHLAATQEKP